MEKLFDNNPVPELPDSPSKGDNTVRYLDLYTQRAEDKHAERYIYRFSPTGQMKKIGMYQGRHIIGRDRPIDGGVFFTSGYREAIVVDSHKYPVQRREYEKLLDELVKRSKKENEPVNQFALWSVYRRVIDLLKYDDERVERLLSKYGIPEDLRTPVKISLDVFLEEHVGVCRHQALLAGLFLERLAKDGYLRGFASIDRNYIPRRDGHVWVRYVNRVGDITIIDPAGKFIGGLDDIDPTRNWNYKRSTDK